MSADRRKQILVGFGALAVVLVVVIAVVRPSFRSDEAAGAIGAVQKHHAPQIAKQDVVLGNEQVKRDQRVLFSGYVAEAKELKSFNLGTREERAESVARLSQKEQELGVRFNEDLTYALGMAKSLASDEAFGLGSKRESTLGIIAILIGQRAENAEQMTALALRLNDVADVLGSARVDMAHLDMASLASANQSLDAISRRELQMRLHAATESLGVMAKESAMIHAASLQVTNLNDIDAASLGARFNDFAVSMEQRAQANAREELKMASDEVAALGRMSELLSRTESAANAANVADTAQLESTRLNMNARFTAVRENVNAISGLASDADLASVLGSDDSFSMQVRALSDEVMDLGSRTRAVRGRETPNDRTHAVRRH